MSNIVYVIHEIDNNDNEQTVIGVVDSPNNIEPLMNEYYRSYEIRTKEIVQEANIYSSYNITVTDPGITFGHKYCIWVEWFKLNQP